MRDLILQLSKSSIYSTKPQMGAKGVAVGRNITQDPQPAKVVAGLNAIIHENATAEDAYSLYMAK